MKGSTKELPKSQCPCSNFLTWYAVEKKTLRNNQILPSSFAEIPYDISKEMTYKNCQTP